MKSLSESSLSLRSRSFLRAASLLLVTSGATGCVAAKDYNEARSVAESEQQGHARTRERLEAAMARIATLEAELTAREQAIAKTENAAEESKLASTVALKEKDAAVQLVETLRSELARTGDSLALFANEKRDLTQTLLVAEERMRDIELSGKNLAELVATTRDLSLALKSELERDGVALGARDGQVIVGIAPERLFGENGDMLASDAASLLAAVGKTSQRHPGLRVIVREPAAAPGTRVAQLAEGLRQGGVVDGRLVLPASAPAQPAAVAEEAPVAEKGSSAMAGTQPLKAVLPASKEPAAGRYEIAFAP
jgi:hypothetical protein